MTNTRRPLALAFALILFPSVSRADEPLSAWLARFHENPSAVMDELPPKIPVSGDEAAPAPFEGADIEDGRFVELKNQVRGRILGTIPRAEAWGNDKVERFLEEPQLALRTLREIEARGLLASALDVPPWSDDYWPIYQGILGARYADPDFGWGGGWKASYDYVLAHPLAQIFASGDPVAIDRLSPSEKYDLITGSKEGRLTDRMWREGQRYYEQTGEVEPWMGICHGWAPASFMSPRPSNAVTVPSFEEGVPIQFYPSDLKALSSLLWANTSVPTRFVGGRCNVKEPAKDENGRVTDQDCFDSNPGTWHLAVVNRIGVARESFVLDATYDYEVWNQPVLGYEYRYFNPETLVPAERLEEAAIPMAAYTKDKFRKHRSAASRRVVGIEMELTYMSETSPRQRLVDGPADDSRITVKYVYDLELDAQDRVIGGEWYGNRHPDFLWAPVRGSRPVTAGDLAIPAGSEWDGETPMPAAWRAPAARSARYGQPLARVLDRLLAISGGTQP